MPRAPFQVLVFPYMFTRSRMPLYAVFQRADLGVWQALAGGGETGESAETAAQREAWEEAGIPLNAPLQQLSTVGQVPVEAFKVRADWPSRLVTIPEYCFAVSASPTTVRCSEEHRAVEWLSYAAARARLHWASNHVALDELHARLVGARDA